MDLETFKSDYQNLSNEPLKNLDNIIKIKNSGNHSALKSIKRQLIIESIIWTFVLIVSYDFFDGNTKSFFWNALLVISILLLLTHNILGLILVKNPINGVNIVTSLKNYLKKIKTYSIISMISRVLMISVFMLYLTSNVEEWSTNKLWSTIGFFSILVSFQIYLLNKVWKKRVHKIEKQIDSFE